MSSILRISHVYILYFTNIYTCIKLIFIKSIVNRSKKFAGSYVCRLKFENESISDIIYKQASKDKPLILNSLKPFMKINYQYKFYLE